MSAGAVLHGAAEEPMPRELKVRLGTLVHSSAYGSVGVGSAHMPITTRSIPMLNTVGGRERALACLVQ